MSRVISGSRKDGAWRGRAFAARLLAVALLLGAPAHAADPPALADELEAAENDYRELQYRAVEQRLRPLLYPVPKFESPDDRLRARELLGAALWFVGEKDKAQQEFQLLLRKQSGHELDKFTYPKPLRDFFDDVRNLLVQQGDITVVVEPDPPVASPPTVIRITQERQSRAVAFLPFGVAQFEQKRVGWGAFFATSQGLAALANIGAYSAYLAIYDGGDRAAQEALFITTIASGAAWIGLTIWGIIDGNVAYEPTLEVVTEIVPATSLPSAELKLLKPNEPSLPGSPRLAADPTLPSDTQSP